MGSGLPSAPSAVPCTSSTPSPASVAGLSGVCTTGRSQVTPLTWVCSTVRTAPVAVLAVQRTMSPMRSSGVTPSQQYAPT